MSLPIIKIENLSKVYRLGEIGTGTLSHDINRFWRMNILGQEDPYAKVGTVNDRAQKAAKGELVNALSDINLEVQQGEVLGIIGKNGAGKSTLLKILSRVTSPTTGTIKIKGRIASLLEVGTGFHPEMTGRENIYMNGTIMGMRRWEIDRKLDEIVEFAGVAKYLDTPTKRYSSGMTVRLGFAIAAHLEPEILVVDEVLAVGDAEFQKKAIGKMQEVSQNQGRTVLFVSHNLGAVSKLTSKSILIHQGELLNFGSTKEIIRLYLKENRQNFPIEYRNFDQKNGFNLIRIVTSSGNSYHSFGAELRIIFKISFAMQYHHIALAFQIINEELVSVLNPLITEKQIKWISEGNGYIECIFPNLRLFQGKYFLTVHLGDSGNKTHIETIERACYFEVTMDNQFAEYGWNKNTATYIEKVTWTSKNNYYEVPY